MRRLTFVAVLLMFVLSVSAVDFTVSLFPSERTINLNDTASFELELEHNSPVEEVFEVFLNDVTWDVSTEKTLTVPAQTKFKTNLLVRPLNLNPGAYNIPVIFRRMNSNDQQKKIVYIVLESPFPEDATYLPAVRGVATIEPQIDPRKGLTIKLSLENQNMRILDKVDVKVRSNVINKDYTTSLGPLEKKTLTFIAELDALTPPQKDALQISIIVPETEKAFQFDLFPVEYEIIAYGSIVPDVSSEKSFLKRVEKVTLTNNANKPLTHVYRVPAWFAKRWFVSGVPEPKVELGALTWEVPLSAGGTYDIVITYNYRPLFWLLLLAVIGFVAYYYFRSPVLVRKGVRVVKGSEESVSELKVIIELINRGNKVAHHVRVMDLAPRLADVVAESKETILAPSKVVPNEQRGTLLRWDIELMEPKEHRVLMYKLHTKLGVLGGISLPVAVVKFAVDGQERESVSNKPEIVFKG
ncbi:Uncharacterised protein [uncultured archaeon]|nr:Uncharacterised protein [uncultured archaeon]